MKVSALFAATLCFVATGYASQDGKPFEIGGFVDLYYQYDFGRPGTIVGSAPSAELNLRQFDVRHSRFRLATAWLDISRAPTLEEPLGFNASLMAGDTAEIIHAFEPGGVDSWKNFGQAYLSYKLPNFTVDLGKFWTPIGYEVADQRLVENYSRGMNYYSNQPLYHTGLRVTAPVSPNLTLVGMVVQGWNEVEDSNGAKSFLLGASFAATEKLSLTLNGYYGREGTADGPVSGIGFVGFEADTTLIDFVAAYQLCQDTKLGLNVDYGDAKGAGKFNGVALYGKQTLGSRSSAALRIEHTEDPQGLRSGVQANYNSITGTFDYKIAENFTMRFELRHDASSDATFNSDSGLKKNRTTLTFAQVLRF